MTPIFKPSKKSKQDGSRKLQNQPQAVLQNHFPRRLMRSQPLYSQQRQRNGAFTKSSGFVCSGRGRICTSHSVAKSPTNPRIGSFMASWVVEVSSSMSRNLYELESHQFDMLFSSCSFTFIERTEKKAMKGFAQFSLQMSSF
jgi:hypothetical protein